ncbi:MAG: T9SS type A sorting domain-containing protein [Bacteroidales bacterium]|nr:T9SS type A sorting domain-containing protein [Bacteroidales bacterium]
MGSVSGGGTYIEGSTATLTATANNGYRFSHWQDNNTSNPRTITVTGNATYVAYFEADAPTQYHITVNSANTMMGSVSGGGTYAAGSTATITAFPNNGYHFSFWNDYNTNNPRTITVAGNATYTAYFEADNYVITVLSDNPTMGTVTGGGTYAFGSTISISAHPEEGCRFAYWQDGNNDNPRYITVTDNAPQYVAHFYRPEGIDDVETAGNLKIYTRGNSIVIDFSGQQAAVSKQDIVVYDVMGRVIKQSADSGQQAAIEIPVTSAGVYMVKVGDRPSRKVLVRP